MPVVVAAGFIRVLPAAAMAAKAAAVMANTLTAMGIMQPVTAAGVAGQDRREEKGIPIT